MRRRVAEYREEYADEMSQSLLSWMMRRRRVWADNMYPRCDGSQSLLSWMMRRRTNIQDDTELILAVAILIELDDASTPVYKGYPGDEFLKSQSLLSWMMRRRLAEAIARHKMLRRNPY